MPKITCVILREYIPWDHRQQENPESPPCCHDTRFPKVDRPWTLQLTWIHWWQCFKIVLNSTFGEQTRSRCTYFNMRERGRLSSHAFFLVAKWRQCRNPTNYKHHIWCPGKINNSVTLFAVRPIITISKISTVFPANYLRFFFKVTRLLFHSRNLAER